MNKDRVEKLGESIADLSKSYKLSKNALTNLASGMEQLRKAIIDEREINPDNENPKKEIEELEKKIIKAQSEIQEWHDEAIAVRKNRDEMLDNFRKGIEPYADLQDMHDKIAQLQDRHQQDCIEINRLNTVIDVLIDKHSRLRKQMGL